jgi:hypothetical protein
MATTTNYGWTTPDDTSLVKDGASAIRTLGSSIDTSLNNALGTKKAGLVLLNTTSFSAVASQSVTDVFSSTYTNYIAIVDFVGSGQNFGTVRLRTASDDSTSNYFWQRLIADTTSVSGSAQASQTSFDIGKYSTGTTGRILHFFKPNVATSTAFSSSIGSFNYVSLYAGEMNTNTQYTGYSIIASSGTITGQVKTYGFN